MERCGVVFPGQGSQRTGMGEDFVTRYQEAREIFARASKAIDVDMEQLCFTADERLNQTEFTQPSILTMEIAALTVLQRHFDFAPHFFAGHSLGEYTALVAAGVLQFADALKIVRKRGALMQSAVPLGKGAMAALILENIMTLGVEGIVTEAGAEVANFNSNDQIVITGAKEGVAAACQALSEKIPQMRIVQLNVSAPFHSSLMKPAQEDFKAYLMSFAGNIDGTNAAKVLSNYTGTFHSADKLIPALVEQMAGPVRWLHNMQQMAASANSIYEVGPQRVLSKFFSTIGVQVKTITDERTLERTMRSTVANAV